MPTDYHHFDDIYRRKRSEGSSGWVDRDSPDWPLHMQWLTGCLQAPWCPTSGEALELGCGAGCWCIELARRGFDVTGVDLAPEAISWARQKARAAGLDIRFVQADVLALADWADARFDFILDGFCLHCLIGPDRDRYLRTARRLLRPDGIFRVQTFCAEDVRDPAWQGWNLDPRTRCQYRDDGTALRYVGHPDALREEICDVGFDILDDGIAPCCGGMLELALRPSRTRP